VARAKHALGCVRSALVGTREGRALGAVGSTRWACVGGVGQARWLARVKRVRCGRLEVRVGHARWLSALGARAKHALSSREARCWLQRAPLVNFSVFIFSKISRGERESRNSWLGNSTYSTVPRIVGWGLCTHSTYSTVPRIIFLVEVFFKKILVSNEPGTTYCAHGEVVPSKGGDVECLLVLYVALVLYPPRPHP
jgi:hypothetical protein